MTTASIQEIKKELRTQDIDHVQTLCMRLAKYKKENKELLNYLLFEAHNEQAYIENVKEEIAELFKTIPSSNVYFIKKSLRKVLRFVNRQIKYSGIKQTELELRIFFCTKMKEAKMGRPCKKLVVPSSGSIIHWYSFSPLESVPSSARTPEPGMIFFNAFTNLFSDSLSTYDTRLVKVPFCSIRVRSKWELSCRMKSATSWHNSITSFSVWAKSFIRSMRIMSSYTFSVLEKIFFFEGAHSSFDRSLAFPLTITTNSPFTSFC